MKANPSAATASSTASSRSAAKSAPAQPASKASAQDFDALLNQPDDLGETDAPALAETLAARDGESSQLAAPDAGETARIESLRDDNQQPAGAAEEAAQASLRPAGQALRPEAASEVTPRRILHVADMGKIMATVRAQTFSGNEAQATIQLSHSILNGLSIKLQTDARGRVSAEITATTDAAKRVVDAHARELRHLLQARGLDIASFSTSLTDDGGARPGGDGGASSQPPFGGRGLAGFADELAEAAPETVAPQPGGDGIYTA
ncbi:MAG: hypothetical protein CFK52_06275 [Chloracidobacterium sp. CP2_5A]|nr:MAG: hypothetical protein CFK52_06275 [Chloracidobacterium sp. CP2_5A]